MISDQTIDFAKSINKKFNNLQLLEEALTHKSWSAENEGIRPNEKLEFHNLEKIVHRDLHLDTDIEKGQRVIELMEKAKQAYKAPTKVDHHASGES